MQLSPSVLAAPDQCEWRRYKERPSYRKTFHVVRSFRWVLNFLSLQVIVPPLLKARKRGVVLELGATGTSLAR